MYLLGQNNKFDCSEEKKGEKKGEKKRKKKEKEEEEEALYVGNFCKLRGGTKHVHVLVCTYIHVMYPSFNLIGR